MSNQIDSKKKIAVTTCVWGDWHIKIFLKYCLPSLLTNNNLKFLFENFYYDYTIATNSIGKKTLENSAIIKSFTKKYKINICSISNELSPPTKLHVDWYNSFISESKKKKKSCLFIQPDHIWSCNSIKNLMKFFLKNEIFGISVPYLRIISETFMDEFEKVSNISSFDLVKISKRHLHHLSTTRLNTIKDSRPSLEKLWYIKDNGFIQKSTARELTIFDPNKIKLSKIWYPGQGTKEKNIKIINDSKEVFFLSLAPLFKDLDGFLPNKKLKPIELSKQSLLELNNISLANFFSKEDIYLGLNKNTSWKKKDELRTAFFKIVVVKRQMIKIRNHLKNYNVSKNFFLFWDYLISSEDYDDFLIKFDEFNLRIKKKYGENLNNYYLNATIKDSFIYNKEFKKLYLNKKKKIIKFEKKFIYLE